MAIDTPERREITEDYENMIADLNKQKCRVMKWLTMGHIWDTYIEAWTGLDTRLQIAPGRMTMICEMLYDEGKIGCYKQPYGTICYCTKDLIT